MKKICGTTLMLFLLIFNLSGTNGPQRISPAKNGTVASLDPEFSWKPLTKQGVKYEVKIAEDQDFTMNVISLKTSYSSLKLSLPYFQKGRSYYWTVRASYIDDFQTVTTTWAHENKKNMDHFQFVVNSDAKGYVGYSPVNVSPEQNAGLNTLQPEFKWQYPDHSELNYLIMDTVRNEWVSPKLTNIIYQLVISASDDFSKESKTFQIENDSLKFKLTIPWLKKNSKYYWRVKAIYMDPEKEKRKESEWSASPADSKVPSAFEISAQAKGKFGFNVGQKEEMFDRSVLKSVVTLIAGPNDCFSPAVTKDGKKLAYCYRVHDHIDIFEVSLTNPVGEGRSGINKTSAEPGQYYFNPFWLPNNSEVGFYSNRYGDWEMRSMEKAPSSYSRGGEKNEEDLYKFELYGSCSSDGKIIYTGKAMINGTYELLLYDINSSAKVNLMAGMFPDIRDDDRIVYSFNPNKNEPDTYQIFITNLVKNAIGSPRDILGAASNYDPVFSPDGTRIAFTSTRSGNSDIWVMDTDGTNPHQVTFHPMVDRRPQWIDDETIVFQSNRDLNDKNEPVIHIFRMSVPKQ